MPSLTAWRLVRAFVYAATALSATPAAALMAGASPDSPALRIDANNGWSRWTSAVAVIVDDGVYSGVVVAPRHVLTAAHVVGGAAAASVRVQINASSIPVVMGATRIDVFPGPGFPYDDLALIELAAPVPTAVRILPIHRTQPPLGTTLTLVGYGASGRGDSGVTLAAAAGIKRRGSNALDAITHRVDGSGRSSLFYLFDFDGPSGFGPLGGPSLGNRREAGLAAGDSGSPAYADLDGVTGVIGINNFVGPAAGGTKPDHRFGTQSGGMLLSHPPFLAWLDEHLRGRSAPSSPATSRPTVGPR